MTVMTVPHPIEDLQAQLQGLIQDLDVIQEFRRQTARELRLVTQERARLKALRGSTHSKQGLLLNVSS